jgi:hypothetical protein
LVYLRRDLLSRHAAETGHELGWVIWGEREIHANWREPPDWYRRLMAAGADEHRRVVALADLG